MIPSFPMTTAERMAAFCKRYEVEPCKLRYSRRATDSIVMTDELLKWHITNGASLDWICLGSVSPMMTAYRNEALRTNRDRRILRDLTPAEQEAMTFVLRAVLDGGLKLQPALDLWTAECIKRH